VVQCKVLIDQLTDPMPFNMQPIQFKIHTPKDQSQEIKNINNVYEFMKREAERKINEVILPKVCNSLQKIQKKVKESTEAKVRPITRL
jgi:hypothetical protein